MNHMFCPDVKQKSKGAIDLITGIILVLLVMGIVLLVVNMIGLRFLDTFVEQIAEKIDYFVGGFKN
ncbi:MAG: hypothetical protein DRN71_01650 [Candidatus Nanohalarchaeota archaeon]|nr:MAG: hypothetical protein DRN71_01650 [Candidatus Nanohaloarchaeota archaeon]